MLAAYLTHPDFSRHEMGPHHPECPERISAIQDALLMRGLLDCMQPMDVPLATREQLSRVHSLEHIDNLAALSPMEGYRAVDPDTQMNPHSYLAALRAAGAAVHATDLVLTGKAPSAFCSIRPPGHHATRNEAMGFCFFNNVAVGVAHALEAHGLERVALIDFDVHHGNGTEDIFQDEPRVLMCSTYEHGIYPFDSAQTRNIPGRLVNVGLPSRSGSAAFRDAVREHWLPALNDFKPQMIFVSAGFDGHREDDMGNLGLTEADYEWVTREIMHVAQRHAQGRVVSCLEGGYAFSALARSVVAHVRVLIGAAD
jgi:acetoin utilization deacetylase AcuC-like enzyme